MKNLYVCSHGHVGRCWDCAQDTILALRRKYEAGGEVTNLMRFTVAGGYKEPDPVERLRFFLSLALAPRDWIDVEPFLDALTGNDQPLGVATFWSLVELDQCMEYIRENHPVAYAECGDDFRSRTLRLNILEKKP